MQLRDCIQDVKWKEMSAEREGGEEKFNKTGVSWVHIPQGLDSGVDAKKKLNNSKKTDSARR